MNKFKDRLASGLEYFLVAVWTLGAISTIQQAPFEGMGPIAAFFGNEIALASWAVLFSAIGLALLISKLRKMKKLHSRSLGASYFVAMFTLLLEALITGGLVELIDSLVIAALSGWLWLRWRLHTAYIDVDEFKDDVEQLRTDLPPPTP